MITNNWLLNLETWRSSDNLKRSIFTEVIRVKPDQAELINFKVKFNNFVWLPFFSRVYWKHLQILKTATHQIYINANTRHQYLNATLFGDLMKIRNWQGSLLCDYASTAKTKWPLAQTQVQFLINLKIFTIKTAMVKIINNCTYLDICQ